MGKNDGINIVFFVDGKVCICIYIYQIDDQYPIDIQLMVIDML